MRADAVRASERAVLSGAVGTDRFDGIGAVSTQLVNAVQPSAGAGQLQSFSLFESKDPFNASGPSSPATVVSVVVVRRIVVVRLRHEQAAEDAAGAAGRAADLGRDLGERRRRVGHDRLELPGGEPDVPARLAHGSSARVAVVGGSYASGSPTLTLRVNTAGDAREHRRRHALHADAASRRAPSRRRPPPPPRAAGDDDHDAVGERASRSQPARPGCGRAPISGRRVLRSCVRIEQRALAGERPSSEFFGSRTTTVTCFTYPLDDAFGCTMMM